MNWYLLVTCYDSAPDLFDCAAGGQPVASVMGTVDCACVVCVDSAGGFCMMLYNTQAEPSRRPPKGPCWCLHTDCSVGVLSHVASYRLVVRLVRFFIEEP
jgi:hypothetical protein